MKPGSESETHTMTFARINPAAAFSRIIAPDCDIDPQREIRYTVACLVNDMRHYEAMRASFRAGGFQGDCEYLYIDNTHGEQVCAYAGLNAMLNAARGKRVILCHQDLRLLTQSRRDLEARLDELDAFDPAWALAGNAGGVAPGVLAVRITDPHGANQSVGQFPARVASLDENFIVVRRDARIGFSIDLSGFHFYGADICLHADLAGWRAYVIDFHLAHLSAGKKDDYFTEMENAFRAKWSRVLGPRWVQTTCSLVRLTGDPLGQLAGRLVEGPFRKLSRRLPGAAGWTRPGHTADTTTPADDVRDANRG